MREGARAIAELDERGVLRHWATSSGRLEPDGMGGYAWRVYWRDHLGSVRAVVDEQGAVVEARDYYAFGLRMPGRSFVAGAPTRADYTGHELDEESGQLYAGARYYVPSIGRWMAVDPLADDMPVWSPYAYSFNNPLVFVDPSGMIPWPIARVWKGLKARFSTNSGMNGGAFGAGRRGGRIHKGLDLNIGSGDHDLGAPVYVTHDGVVTRVAGIDQDSGTGGNRVTITAANGEVATSYNHLQEMPDLQVGDVVSEGDRIGAIGGSGSGRSDAYTPHLHYVLFRPDENGDLVEINPVGANDELIDPQVFIDNSSDSEDYTARNMRDLYNLVKSIINLFN